MKVKVGRKDERMAASARAGPPPRHAWRAMARDAEAFKLQSESKWHGRLAEDGATVLTSE